MIIFLTTILFILAVALIVLVLIQPDRSHGMAGSFGSGASNTIFGVSADGGPLAKATEVIALLFVIVAVAIYILSNK